MKQHIQELIPHAPNLGLYLAPDIPDRKLQRALSDYAVGFSRDEVLALYDATRLGSGGDGAVFGRDRFAFQNSNLESAQQVRYTDVVGAQSRRRLLGGRYIRLEVNRGRATVASRMDFSARPDAAAYVVRLLQEAMLWESEAREEGAETETDSHAVRAALEALVADGRLTRTQMNRMLDALR